MTVEATPPASARHLPALDGLRGLAVLSVILVHANVRFGGPFAGGPAATVMGFGWAGVDLFFVLSGFLITGILLEARGSPGYYRNFYARRVLRIFPLYYGFLATSTLFLPGAGRLADLAPAPNDVGPLWLYVYNVHVVCTERYSVGFHHFWSLSVEEHFYLAWPVVVALCPPGRLTRVCLAGVVLSLGLRMYVVSAGYWLQVAYLVTPCRLDGLLAGALVAIGVRERPALVRRLIRPLALGGGLAVAAVAAYQGHLYDFADRTRLPDGPAVDSDALLTVGLTALAAVFAAAVAHAATAPRVRWLEGRLLRSIGTYSYGMYVFHVLAMTAVAEAMNNPPFDLRPAAEGLPPLAAKFALFGGTVSLAYLVARVSYHVYERPFLQLKRHFEYRPPARGPG
jgi:peptidoglycan/LPS O-acetylase OafA/YrhL